MTKDKYEKIGKAVVEGHDDALLAFGNEWYKEGISDGYLYMAIGAAAAWLLTKAINRFGNTKLKKEMEEEES